LLEAFKDFKLTADEFVEETDEEFEAMS